MLQWYIYDNEYIIYVTMICYDVIYNMIEGNSFQIYLSSHTHHAHEHLKCDAQKFKQKRRKHSVKYYILLLLT